ncbi:MAG: metallopeptidase TldD-related protein [Kofleriaceae bacterium]
MNRRELLGGLGLASAQAALWALGCGGVRENVRESSAVENTTAEVKEWLHDAVARIAVVHPTVHALAVTRRRTLAARDVLDANVMRGRRDGLVLTVRERDGSTRELATSDLSEAGIAQLAKTLGAAPPAKKPTPKPGKTPLPSPPASISEEAVSRRVDQIIALDKQVSRIVYAVVIVDVEESTVWAVSPSHDREQRLVRIREQVLRVAWNGPRPVVGEAQRAWMGPLDTARGLDEAAVRLATRHALELMTPGTFEDRERAVILEPSVVASLVEAGTRMLLTRYAARRPEVQSRLVVGVPVASPLVTLVDDPTARGAYGGFQFDDAGEPAQPITLIDGGRLASTLDRGRLRRPGHTGRFETAPSHLLLRPGTIAHTAALPDEGFILEGGGTAVVDASTSRVVIGAARAREIKLGKLTGRVYPEVELVGDLAKLLASVSAVSSDTAAFGYRDEHDGEPRWRSVEAPWLRTNGLVRARRRTA